MRKSIKNDRREFLQKMLAVTAAAGFYPYSDTLADAPGMQKKVGTMPLGPLGKADQMLVIEEKTKPYYKRASIL